MSAAGRIHSMDGLRALAMLLILPAHALALIGLRSGWDDFQDSVFWVIHVFRLPLFFLVAGFFAALMIEGRGVAGLFRNRAVRIGIPLTVGLFTAVPLLTLGLRSVSASPVRPGSGGLETFADLHPSYLWFLWYLLLLYAGGLLVRFALSTRPGLRDSLRGATTTLSHWSAPLLLGAVCAALLYRQPQWITGTPATSFAPQLDLLAYYAVFFACGWVIFAMPGLRERIELRPRRYALLSATVVPPALALYLLRTEPAVGANRWLHLLSLLLLSIATWAMVFGLLGLARRFLHRPNPRLRYWADASYWIYLSHFPVMTAIAIVLLDVEMPGALQAVLLVAATLLLVYPAYGAFVRHSPIGRVLHGPRPKRDHAARLNPQPERSAA